MTELSPPWPILLIALPLVTALVAFAAPRLARCCGLATMAGVPALLVLLTLWLGEHQQMTYPLGGWPAELGIGLAADGLALWLLWLTAAVNLVVGLYSPGYFTPPATVSTHRVHHGVSGHGASHLAAINPAEHDLSQAPDPSPQDSGQPLGYFYPLWLLLWATLNGLLLSADLFNIYVGLELLGLAAVCLVTLSGTGAARRAALRYLLLNIFGSLCFLLGVVLIYRQTGSLNLALFAELTSPDPLIRLALALITLGMIIKSALFPLHFWLPPAHASAPAPVSALLSALVVKASLYLLVRIWLPLWQYSDLELSATFQLLGGLGAAAVFWGSIQALRTNILKELIAYSTVAQMGYLFLVFPLLAGPDPRAAVYGLLFFLTAHALAKTALFLAAGTAQQHIIPAPPLTAGKCPGKGGAGGKGQTAAASGSLLISDLRGLSQKMPLTAITMALAAVILMGLPPSGGFIGKWYLLVASLAAGQWWWAVVILGGGLLSMSYLLRPVAATFSRPPRHELTARITGPTAILPAPLFLQWPALLLALAGILLGIFPWLTLDTLGGGLPAGWEQPGGRP